MNVSKLLLVFDLIVNVCKFIILKRIKNFNDFIKKNNSSTSKLSILNEHEIIKTSQRIFKILSIKSCLIQSLALREILQKRGYQSSLVIGIRNYNGNFESHCWLETTDFNKTHNQNISDYKIISKI